MLVFRWIYKVYSNLGKQCHVVLWIKHKQYREREQLIELIKESVRSQSLTFLPDMWNERYRQLSYFATIYLLGDIQFLSFLARSNSKHHSNKWKAAILFSPYTSFEMI
jgi:hypothetical protein